MVACLSRVQSKSGGKSHERDRTPFPASRLAESPYSLTVLESFNSMLYKLLRGCMEAPTLTWHAWSASASD